MLIIYTLNYRRGVLSMKGKVIYVDFSSKTKRATYAETPNNMGFWSRLLYSFKKIFGLSETQQKHKPDSFNFKQMV
jgi:hypothetical protein